MSTKIFEPHLWKDENRKISYYIDKMEGYQAAKKVFASGTTPDQVVDEVKKANIRSRHVWFWIN